MAGRKNNIFEILGRLDKKDYNYFDDLPEDNLKEVQPFVLMRWLTGTKDVRQIVFLNELVNPFVFSFSTHKSLLIKLLTICTGGNSKRYFWNKANQQKQSSTPISVGVVKSFFGYNTVHANEALTILESDDILSYAEQMGYDSTEIKKIKKELKDK